MTEPMWQPKEMWSVKVDIEAPVGVTPLDEVGTIKAVREAIPGAIAHVGEQGRRLTIRFATSPESIDSGTLWLSIFSEIEYTFEQLRSALEEADMAKKDDEGWASDPYP